MKKITLLIVLFTANIFGQTITRLFPIPTNSPIYSMGNSAPIVQTPDNGFLLNYSYSYPNWDGFPGYTTSIIKTDSNFIPLWNKRTGIGMGNGKKTIVLNDGSYLIYFDTGSLLKLDANGQTLFSIGNFTTYPDRLNIADVELIGNTIKVIGTKDAYNGFGFVTTSIQVMIDFDINGNILQTYVLNDGGTSPWTRPTNICKDNSGNYYITGYSYADGNYVCKFNSSNTLLWCRRFNYSANGIIINDMISLNNGDLLLAGSVGAILLYRISSATGTPISAKTSEGYTCSVNTISQLSNGDLITTGWLREDEDSFGRTFSMKMDDNEVFSWLKLYNYGFGISSPFVKSSNNWYYTAFHNNYANNNYPILFNTENSGVTNCPYNDISLTFNNFLLNSSSINMTITPNSSLWETPSTATNFYPTESQVNDDACLSLDVNEMNEATNLTIYPNPSKGEIQVISKSEIKSIEITNILGQNVKNYYPNQLETSILIESNGIYLLKIKTESGIKNTKIIISN